MAYSCNILLGRIVKALGFDGAVSVKLERSFIGKIPEMESVFIEIDGRPVPFFIDEADSAGEGLLKLKFRFYNTVNEVKILTGCRVFLNEPGLADNSFQYVDLLKGYTVISSEDKYIGIIEEIIQNPGQVLLGISGHLKKGILMPLHEDLIVSLDKKSRKIILVVPDGITEIN